MPPIPSSTTAVSVTAEWKLPPVQQLPHPADAPEAWGTLADRGLHNPMRDFPHADWVEHGWDEAHAAAPEPVGRFHDRYRWHLDRAHPAVQMPTAALEHIAGSGRIKTQFETGRSSGLYDPERRMDLEYHKFGYPDDHPDEARPVYGYLTRHPYTDDSTSSYGSHTLVLHKPRIWHRTSFSGADSLDHAEHVSPVPVHDYRMHAVPLEHFNIQGGSASSLSRQELHRRLRNADPEDLADMFWNRGDREHPFSYPEAQYHGGVSLQDVRHVILRTPGRFPRMNAEVAEHAAHLTRAGIPWVHTNGWRRPVDDDPHFRPRRGEASR